MREAFARWARLCNPVTHSDNPGLQKIACNIEDVTHVTRVTPKNNNSEKTGAPPTPGGDTVSIQTLAKNRVTWVTPVTNAESLDNSCNPTCSPRVTGLQDSRATLAGPPQDWPPPGHPPNGGPVPPLSPTRAEPHWNCYCCKGQSYFVNLGGQRICSRCHPPMDPIRFPVHS